MGTLAGARSCFDRVGVRFASIERDELAIVDACSRAAIRVACAGARAVAGFDDQLWIATDTHVHRLELSGRAIGVPLELPFAPRDAPVPAPCGPPAAVWPGFAIVDDFGELVVRELHDADAIIPLTGRKHVTVHGARVTLPSGIVVQLPSRASVLAGAVTADGKLLVLQRTKELIAIAMASGAIVHRFSIATEIVRLASRRGIALAQVEPTVLVALDLRAGRELGTIALDAGVGELAIDPDARRIAIGTQLFELEALFRGRIPVPVPPALPSTPPPIIVAISLAPPEPAARTPIDCPPLAAFAPRTRPSPIDRTRALAELDAELRAVSLWALGAIAAAWDSRRLGYGNEGRHPYELEVAAILGTSHGHATDYVCAAREQLASHDELRSSDPGARGPDTPLGALAGELGLGDRAVDVLLVIAAASLWGEIARLYGILANDAVRPLVDELLVQQVLAARHDRHAVAAEVDPRAPLVRLGIVHVDSRRARPFAGLTIDAVVLDRLRAQAADLGPATTILRADRSLDELDMPRTVLDAAIAALSTATTARVVVRGRRGSGRRTLLAVLAARAGRDLARIDASALELDDDLRQALCRARLEGHVPCVVGLDQLEPPAQKRATGVLAAHAGPLAIIVAPDAAIAIDHVAIDVPALSETERREAWLHALAEAGLGVADVDVLAARYRIGPGAIRRATAAVARAPGDDASHALDLAIRRSRDAHLGELARRVERTASWSSVVLPPDVLDSLRELVARVRHRRVVFETWGMSRLMATSRGLTALFQGQPGTGKTLVAGVIARELGLDLYQVDLAKVTSKWIGETERNLGAIFDAADDGQVVLLFDEADSLFAKRTEVRSSNDRYANLEVNYLLQRLDAFEGIAILTTNAAGSIDEAFKRRLSFRLSFPFPDEDTREQLWRAHVPPELPTDGPLVFDALARKYALSGGYIRNACLRAAFLAAQDETRMHQHHLERAIALELAEMGKLSSSGEIS